MNPNCIILSPNDDLVKEIQALYPIKSFKVIKAEIGALLNTMIEDGRSNGQFLPTIEDYKRAYHYLEDTETSSDSTILDTSQDKTKQKYTISSNRTADYADYTILQERMNKEFQDSQKKANRVNMVARAASQAITNLYNRYLEKAKAEGIKPMPRQKFATEKLPAILFGKDNELSPLQKTIISGRNVREDDVNKEYKLAEYKKLADNNIWKMLVQEAANILFTTEGVYLNIIEESVSNTNIQNQSDDADPTFDNRSEGDSTESIKDGWMIKAREVDVRDTLSEETRKILNEIKRIDRKGNLILDDLGQPMYLNPDDAHLVLLEACSEIATSEQFIPTLENLTKKYAWVQQIVNIIKEDQKNKFWTITPKLYHDLRKEFVPYYVQALDRNDKMVTKQVNKSPSVFYLLNKWRANYEAGIILNSNSIYDEIGNINKGNAERGSRGIEHISNALRNKTAAEYIDYFSKDENINKIGVLLNMLGIEFSSEEILSTLAYDNNIINNTSLLLKAINTVFTQVSKNDYKQGTDFINEFSGAFNEIAELFNSIPEGSVIASFREAGKNRQSYSAPSYLGNLITKFKNKDVEKFKQFIEDEYGQYSQFKVDGRFNSVWLRLLTNTKKNFRDLLNRKVVIHRGGIEFNDWTDSQYYDVIIQEYFDSPDDEKLGPTAYYALPLLADAPSAEFIKFIRVTDTTVLGQTAKETILDLLSEEAWNEYQRILCVKSRAESNKRDETKALPIANFDKVGDKFQFFPFIPSDSDSLAYYNTLSKADLLIYFRDLIRENEDIEFENFLNKHSYELLAKDKNGNPVSTTYYQGEKTRSQLEEFFYNNALAYINIVRLTTTDLSYYKNLNDFQKRYKEVYAMTNRMYWDSSFGFSKKRKVAFAKDIEFTVQPIKEMTEALNKAVKEGHLSSTSKDYILSQYNKVNATDAQGIVTLNAVKKVMMMTGNWTEAHEDAKLRMEGKKEGGFLIEDFNLLYETAKPFMFTQMSVDSDCQILDKDGNIRDYGKLKVPIQLKNSEFVLLAIYGSVAAGLSNSPIYKALNNWMIDNDIDLFQFDSGAKVGNQSPIDLNGYTTEEDVLKVLNNSLNISNTVKELDWEDYGIQSFTPEHLVDHEALIGSQAKKLISADLPETLSINLKGMNLNPKAIHSLLDMLMSCGYIEGYKECEDIFSDKKKLSETLLKEMEGNSRYTDEERYACTINEKTGDFNIPLHDPIQSNRIQQLLNGIIKKKVTKQQTVGGSVTQVSNFGVTDDLQVRYNDAEGNLVFTEREWNNPNFLSRSSDKARLKKIKADKNTDTYEKYKLTIGNASSMAYFEAYLPAYTKKFFNVLGRSEGNFDIKDLPEELRYCLGYRIPTEAKYSMQKIYIKGFLPQENGSAIMLPSEITTIVGSDFDIDHVYLMLPSVEVRSKIKDRAYDFYKKNIVDSATDKLLSTIFEEDVEAPKFKDWFKEEQKEGRFLPEEGDAYVTKAKVRGLNKIVKVNGEGSITDLDLNALYKIPRDKRNNLILDIFMQVLSQPECIAQQLKPGGFDDASKEGALMTFLDNITPEDLLRIAEINGEINPDNIWKAYTKLHSLGKKQLKNLSEEYGKKLNPLSIETQLYFHSQNANGGKMIGVYAVGNAAHCIGEHGDTHLISPIEVFGRRLSKIDNVRDVTGNNLISENIAQFLAASVDNVKDPVLAALNQTPDTGDITLFLLRAGLPLSEVSLIMTTPYTDINPFDNELKEEASSELIRLSGLGLMNYKTLLASRFNLETITGDNGTSCTLEEFRKAFGYLMYKISRNARDLSEVTQAFRGDALSSAAGPTIGDNILRYLKLRRLQNKIADNKLSVYTDLIDINSLLVDSNYSIDSLLRNSYEQGSPFVYAATKCGVAGTMQLLKTVFPQVDSLLSLITDREFGLTAYCNITSSTDAAKLINDFFNELIIYALQGTNYFGGRSIEETKAKNLYYLTTFPNVFEEFKNKYPKLASSNALLKNLNRNNKGAYNRILFSNSGNLTKQLKETIMNDWAMLLATSANDTLTEQQAEEIRNMGFELFKYASNFGLTFGNGSSFIHLAPNILRRAIKDYDKTVRTLSFNKDLVPFVQQFMNNHLVDTNIPTRTIYSSKSADGQQEFFIKARKGTDIPKYFKSVDSTTQETTYFKLYSNPTEAVVDSEGNIKVSVQKVSLLGVPKVFREYYYGAIDEVTAITKEVSKNDNFYSLDEMPDYVKEGYNYEDVEGEIVEDTIVDEDTYRKVYDAEGNLVESC